METESLMERGVIVPTSKDRYKDKIRECVLRLYECDTLLVKVGSCGLRSH